MKVYRVGGSVRDSLMGLTPHDHDYVVVGATPAEMEALGYKQVGKDFPVFLHPDTGEEYALARKERKTGLKHTDFETVFDTSVTIEEDLLRRDLTINAIAVPYNFEGDIVDPFGGQEDIKNKIIRHVSEAFAEDPLRVLRVARFCARFKEFSLHDSTKELCKTMVENGDLNHLSKERIFEEFNKAAKGNNSWVFVYKLREFGLDYCKPSRVIHYQIRSLDNSDHYTDEQKMIIKFILFFGGETGETIKDRMKAISIPNDYIQATEDYFILNELTLLFDEPWHPPSALDMYNLISKVNWNSRCMKMKDYVHFMTGAFSSPKIRRAINSYMDAQKTIGQFVKDYTDSEGEAPNGRIIGEHLKSKQLEFLNTSIMKSIDEHARFIKEYKFTDLDD
jgi:hypothetical protein